MVTGIADGRYGPLSGSLGSAMSIAEPQPRRPLGLPSFLGLGGQANVLPLSRKDKTATAYNGGSPSLATSAKLSSRRLSNSLGLGGGRLTNRLKLLLAGLVICGLIFLSNRRTPTPSRRLRTRAQLGNRQKTYKFGGGSNGLSLIDNEEGADEESWLEEVEPWFSQYDKAGDEEEDWTNVDYSGMSEEEVEQKKEMIKHKIEVADRHKAESLRALAWFVAEGGELPADWEVPTKKHLTKIGGRGVEHVLRTVDEQWREEAGDNSPGEEIFEEGWAEFAKARYRTVVFSKTFCPYSKRAKGILENYHLTPAPFIIELDIRPDGPKIQSLLEHLTGRRTVPNILLDFVSIGGADDLTLMHAEGGLKRKFEEMQVLPGSRRIGAAARAAIVQGGAQAHLRGLEGVAPAVGPDGAQIRQAVAAAPVVPVPAPGQPDHAVPVPVAPAADGVDVPAPQAGAAADRDSDLDAAADDDDDYPAHNDRAARAKEAAKAVADAKAAEAAEAAEDEAVEADEEEDGEEEETARAAKVQAEAEAADADAASAPAPGQDLDANGEDEEEEKAPHRLGAFAMNHADDDADEDDEDDETGVGKGDRHPAIVKQKAQIKERVRAAAKEKIRAKEEAAEAARAEEEEDEE